MEKFPLHPEWESEVWACSRVEGPWGLEDWFDVRCRLCFLALCSIARTQPDLVISDHCRGILTTPREAVEFWKELHEQ